MKFWTLFIHLWSFKTSKLLKKIYTFNFQRTWILTENVDDTEINLTKNKIFRNLLRIIFWSKSTISPFAEFYVKRNLSIRNICVQVPSSFNAVLQQRVAPTRQQVSNPLPIPTKSNHHTYKVSNPSIFGLLFGATTASSCWFSHGWRCLLWFLWHKEENFWRGREEVTPRSYSFSILLIYWLIA